MITFTQGDILRDSSEALVNTVNCVGVMGRGIALQFRNAFPGNFEAYQKACKRDEVRPGRMFVHETGELTGPRYIVNFPTKRHWREKSRIEDIDSGLAALVEWILTARIRSIAVPPLGSGLGGLDWSAVREKIVCALGPLEEVTVTIYEPAGAPAPELMTRPAKAPGMTPGRAALVELMHQYLGGLLDPVVTLLEVHKLMYFLQETGEPLNLRYAKALYGPYAENLGHVLRAVEGHYLCGYADGGDAPDNELNLISGAREAATQFLATEDATRRRLGRVEELVRGFESPFGLELLATVHWVATREGPSDVEALVERTYAWNQRKRQFTPRQIGIAAGRLQEEGWLTLPGLAA